jgi:hypothetical protein
MIQDMHNPEYYMEEYEVHNTVTGVSYMRSGKYKDLIVCEVSNILPHISGLCYSPPKNADLLW